MKRTTSRLGWGLLTATLLTASVAATALAAPTTRPALPQAAAPAPPGQVVEDAAAYAKAAKSKDWTKTPFGLVKKSCVTELTGGARLDGSTLRPASGPARKLSCAEPRLVEPGSLGAKAASRKPQAPVSNGWHIASDWHATTWLRRLYVNYTVPAAPAKNGALIYLFSSFEPTNGSSIVQPVLQYGNNGYFGGNYWTIASWYLWGGNVVHGPPVQVNTGNTIWGAMEANTCQTNGSKCHWAIITRNQSAAGQPQSRIDINSDSIFQWAQSSVLETYDATSCTMWPADKHAAFGNIAVYGPTFNLFTPTWAEFAPDRQCSATVTWTTNSADIRWK